MIANFKEIVQELTDSSLLSHARPSSTANLTTRQARGWGKGDSYFFLCFVPAAVRKNH